MISIMDGLEWHGQQHCVYVLRGTMGLHFRSRRTAAAWIRLKLLVRKAAPPVLFNKFFLQEVFFRTICLFCRCDIHKKLSKTPKLLSGTSNLQQPQRKRCAVPFHGTLGLSVPEKLILHKKPCLYLCQQAQHTFGNRLLFRSEKCSV